MVKKLKRVLILAVDRDNDMEVKAGIKGPVIGKKKCIEGAIALAAKDPGDSDVNTIFEALKNYDELVKEVDALEIATLTGDRNVGVISDQIIGNQLDNIIKRFKPEGVVFVSDGSEDEQVLPLVESRCKIISVRRVIIKQSQELEKAYVVVLDFLKKSLSDKNLAKIVIGLPGLAALVLAMFGSEGWRLIIGSLGVYLILRGFGYSENFFSTIKRLRKGFSTDRPGFVFYMGSLVSLIIGILTGAQAAHSTEIEFFKRVAVFIDSSVYIILLSMILAYAGKLVDAHLGELGGKFRAARYKKYALLSILTVMSAITLKLLSAYILDAMELTTSVILIVVSLLVSFYSLKKLKVTTT